MANNIKLYNPQKFNVGLKLQGQMQGLDIKPGSFVMVSEDDVNYIASISSILQRGILRIENSAENKEDVAAEVNQNLGIDTKNDPLFADDLDIRQKLGGSAKKIGEWLDSVTEPYMLDRIYDVAMTMDLPASKLAKLREKMPERSFVVGE